jgi:ABC-type multidrug transport system ATPase subunit
MPPAYEIRHLTRTYPAQPQPANDDISLTIEQGEFFGLLGDNGAGKTTLIKQMANLLQSTSGEIRLFGKPLQHEPLYSTARIGYMPQSGLALNNATVGEALYFTAHLRGLSRQAALQEQKRLLELLDIGAMRDKAIPRLSGGQRRMVLLGTTIAASPPIVILDEPTNDLAPQNRLLVWEVLRQLHTTQGTTLILVTHNVLEAERVIQRVGIMRQGKLIALGRPGVLKADLNEKLRLEIIFAPSLPPALPPTAAPRELAPGRWSLLIAREDAAQYLACLNSANIEDFHLGTATLEDLYLALVQQQ